MHKKLCIFEADLFVLILTQFYKKNFVLSHDIIKIFQNNAHMVKNVVFFLMVFYAVKTIYVRK